jgi:alcohol dehydrogenase class IV
MTKYFNPVKVIHSNNWLIDLHNYINYLKILNPIIVTSPGNKVRLNLMNHFNKKSIYSFKGSNPTFDDCKTVIEYCHSRSIDGVIAIGGGSPMDLAKIVMAYLGTGETNVLRLIKYKNKYPRVVPSIFVPTTHGTGSEVTMWGTIWNMVEKKKYSITHPSLYPSISILDGSLTLTLPLDISIITAMDALSHSFEAIWNKNSNSKSTEYAIESICLILENIEKLIKDQNDLSVRKLLLKASNISGLAFSNTKTAAAHSISYPLTIHLGIPHGIASSITLLPLLDINRGLINESLDIICNNLKLNYNELKESIKDIPYGILPYTLDKLELSEGQLLALAKESFTNGRLGNNIMELTFDDVLTILKKINIH